MLRAMQLQTRWLGLVVLVSALLLAPSARALDIQGTLPDDLTTWTGTINLLGDVTVAAGKKLVIQPGATLSAAATDGLFAGDDKNAVELIVEGTLEINGSSGQHVTLTGSGSSWYGVRVLPGGTATITYADVSKAHWGARLGATSTVTASTFTGYASQNASCLEITGAANASQVSSSYFTKCNYWGIYVGDGSPTLSKNVLYDNYYGVGVGGGSPIIDNNTIHKTTYYGIYFQYTFGTATLTDNIISNFGGTGYGINNNSGSGTINADYNNVWTNNLNTTTAGAMNFGSHNTSANPLFVNANALDGLRLTSNSPSRKAASGGADQGALPYVADATAGLVGTLFTNTTLSGAQSVLGDLTVPPGVTLTIDAGASLSFAQSDIMWAGTDHAMSELIVQGTLVINGSSGQHVTLTGASTTWYGVRVLPGGTATITYADLSKAQHALLLGATSTVTASTFTGYASQNASCLEITGAANASQVSSSYFTKCNYWGIYVGDGSPTLSKNVLYDNYYGVGVGGGSPIIDNNTIHKTTYYGIYFQYTFGTATLTDNIISNFGGTGYGINNNSGSGTINADYNDIWTNGITTTTAGAMNLGTHNLSANPLFVSATDQHLQSTSPCRNKDSQGGDVGAYSYTVGALDHIVVQPGSYSVAGGQDVYFSAIGYDAANNVLSGLTFTWSAKPEAGTITQGGVLTTGCTAATVTSAVTASSGGKSGSANLTITTGPVTKLVIVPSAPSVSAGGQQSFTAQASDACNNPAGAASVTWSTPTGQGSINSSGLYTASCTVGAFPGAVQAKAGDLVATVDVTVVPGAVATLTLTPASASVPPGGSQQFTAGAVDSCGNSTAATFAWDTSISGATVSSSGLFTAGSTSGSFPGGVTVSASGKSKSADVSVPSGSVATIELQPTSATLAIGDTQSFTAVAKDKDGNVVSTTITWSVVAGGGTINQSGLFTAGTTAGSFPATVRASAEGVNATASVTVLPGAIDHLAVSPATVTIAPGGMTTLQATVYDAHDNVLSSAVSWSMKTAEAGSISDGGLFTAGTTIGSYPGAIEASAGGKTASASVTISAGALFSLEIKPPVAAVTAGGSIGFTVVGKDGDGNTVQVSPTWSAVAGGGTINSAGVFQAGTTTGTFANTVRCEANGLQALATVTVTPGPVVQIEVRPTHPTVQAGDTVQFSATALDAFGNVTSGAAIVWSALPSAGTISAAGLFTAGQTNGDFAQAVTATVGVISGSASVAVEGGASTPGDMASSGGSPDLATGERPTNPGGGGCGGCQAAPTETLPGLILPLLVAWRLRRRRAV